MIAAFEAEVSAKISTESVSIASPDKPSIFNRAILVGSTTRQDPRRRTGADARCPQNLSKAFAH